MEQISNKLTMYSLPESLLTYINSYLDFKNYIFLTLKSSGKIFLSRNRFYFLVKLLPNLTTRFEKKKLYSFFGIHHAEVTFSNGSKLTMVDIQRTTNENESKPSYFELVSNGTKYSTSWTTGNDFEVISYKH